MSRCAFAIWAMLASLALPAATSHPARGEVSFTVAPYVWLTGVSADVTIRNVSVSSNASFADLVRDSETLIGLMGYADVRYRNWVFFVEGFYSKITNDEAIQLGPLFRQLPLSTKLETAVVDFALGYRIPLIESDPRLNGWSASIEPYVGGRYLSLESKISGSAVSSGPLGTVIPVNQSASASGVDPIFGAWFNFEMPEGFRLALKGDVGGFGVNTEFTWSAMGLLGWRFNLWGADTTAWAGYKALGFEKETTTSGGAFKIKQVLHGPVIGMSFRF